MNIEQKYIENGFFMFNTRLENNLRNIITKFTKIYSILIGGPLTENQGSFVNSLFINSK